VASKAWECQHCPDLASDRCRWVGVRPIRAKGRLPDEVLGHPGAPSKSTLSAERGTSDARTDFNLERSELTFW
jgi:hypothetical protein